MLGSTSGVAHVGNEVRGVDTRCTSSPLVLPKPNRRWTTICACLDMGAEGILDGFQDGTNRPQNLPQEANSRTVLLAGRHSMT